MQDWFVCTSSERSIIILYNKEHRFYALHEMPARTSDEKVVCLSVRLSNACIVTERKKDLSRFWTDTRL